MKKKSIGSTFDGLPREDGIYEEVNAGAIKRVLARQVEAAMKEKHFSKAEMARKMHTSRAALDRSSIRITKPSPGALCGGSGGRGSRT